MTPAIKVMDQKRARTFLQVQITPELKAKFLDKLEQNNTNITDTLLKMIEGYVNGEERVDLLDLRQRVELLEHQVPQRQNQKLLKEIARLKSENNSLKRIYTQVLSLLMTFDT
ncbi:MAG: hypothetical protein PUP93_16730 [Rhizonema sp. NSF051]|nr:hypothetical protein [Rhizonema sp. NSF051]